MSEKHWHRAQLPLDKGQRGAMDKLGFVLCGAIAATQHTTSVALYSRAEKRPRLSVDRPGGHRSGGSRIPISWKFGGIHDLLSRDGLLFFFVRI